MDVKNRQGRNGCGQLDPDSSRILMRLAVMDRIGGWIEGGRIEDGSQIGGRLAASLWIYTKAKHMDVFRKLEKFVVREIR